MNINGSMDKETIGWVRPETLGYVRLRCENPACDLFYLAHPEEPVFLCLTCLEKQRRILLRRTRLAPHFYNPVRVFNRYDRPLVDHLRS